MAFGDVVSTANEGNVGSFASLTVELGSTATSGNLLVSTATWDKNAGTPTCRDTSGSGDFWTVQYVESSDSMSSSAIAWKISDGDETECFWAWSNNEDLYVTITEYEGDFNASPEDEVATAFDVDAVDRLDIGPTGTLSQADNLAVYCGGQDSAKSGLAIDTAGWSTDFVNDTGLNGDASHIMGKQITSSTTALEAELSSDGDDEWSGVLVVFKKAAAGATGTGAQTLPALLQSATGDQIIAGTASQTLPALSQSASVVMGALYCQTDFLVSNDDGASV